MGHMRKVTVLVVEISESLGFLMGLKMKITETVTGRSQVVTVGADE